MNWEQWLRSAAARPSNNEETNRDRTERQIVDALNDYPALAGRPWRVYVKGSYANNTNVRLNFDVDIAVEYYGYFYFDMALELKGHDQSEVGVVDTTDTYSREEFKADIRGALEKAFGKSAIKPGRIAAFASRRPHCQPTWCPLGSTGDTTGWTDMDNLSSTEDPVSTRQMADSRTTFPKSRSSEARPRTTGRDAVTSAWFGV
jgi:hypothetical protein